MDAKTKRLVTTLAWSVGPIIAAVFINGALERRSAAVDARALACAFAAGLICIGLRLALRVKPEGRIPATVAPLVVALIVMTSILATNLVDRSW